jgi:muramoyltetrapeptide carboxypeptidase LdcA involved in peptidoglycan recycling
VGPDLEPRLAFCLDFLRSQGYRVRIGECLRSDAIASAPAADRARELTAMLLDDDVAAVPVIYDMDIGHLPPQLVLVNGALATLTFSASSKALTQRLV